MSRAYLMAYGVVDVLAIPICFGEQRLKRLSTSLNSRSRSNSESVFMIGCICATRLIGVALTKSVIFRSRNSNRRL